MAFFDLSDSYFLFADLVGFYTHWTYMHIFPHIFLSNYWWQRSDIWSQASYRYPISLSIVAEKNVTTNVHICSMCIETNQVGKQEVGIWQVKKRFPRYEVPIWSLWPNIRFLPSIDAEKNATKNEHICSMCIKINSRRYTILWVAFLDPSDSYFLFADLVGFYTHWTYMHIFRRIFLSNYWWQKSDIWSQASYRYPISWEAFFHDNPLENQ
jgi:ribosomal protein L37AE/L43A